MRRISGSTALANGNGPGKTGFQDLDPNLGILGTIVTAAWMNAIQEELASLVEAAGLTLSDTDTTQVARAIKALGGLGRVAIAAGAADAITATFTPPIASLTAGLNVLVRAAYANAAAAPTFAAGSAPAKPIVREAATALAPGDIAGAGHWLSMTYDATLDKWVLGNPARADLAPLDSPALTGSPTAPTPAQFDAGTKVATTAFVQRALGSNRGVVGLSAGTTLTANHIGMAINLSNQNPFAVTLPQPVGLPDGAAMDIVNTAAGTVTIVSPGTNLLVSGYGYIPSFVIRMGDTARLVLIGGKWTLVGGSAQLAYAGAFVGVLSMPGYQRLPGGLLLQWGSATIPANTNTNITMPVAAGVFSAYAALIGGPSTGVIGITAISTTTLQLTSTITQSACWLALCAL